MKNPWEQLVALPHLSGEMRERLERRKRLKQVRYICFGIQKDLGLNKSLSEASRNVFIQGFVDFWLHQVPKYMVSPTKQIIPVPEKWQVPVHELGGYEQFAKRWDVDHDLNVYLRHSSIWQEWNATLMRVVPVLGEGE